MNWLNTLTPFEQRVAGPLTAKGIEIFQINVGYRCNLECRHCHVEAGPNRQELMSQTVMEACLQVLRENPIPNVDITGGAPEMHPHLPWFLEECAALKRRLQVRTNGVIMLEEKYAPFLDLYARIAAEVVVSFPHVDRNMTGRQRGEGVYFKLIEVIGKLNERGYGQPGSGLILNLVHNPSGAYLPGSQSDLESLYRQVLKEKFGIVFNSLFCITDMPIGRYLDYLVKTDNYEDYMTALVNAFNPATVENVMCATTLSVAWDGKLYDCDFNQMLGMTVNHGAPENISAFDFSRLAKRRIVTGNHCYGCTAGAGSSCAGTLA
ncbi:MAG: Antilisterial bacteriocin subtilosin biosynthesis protein AlbA [Syntrophus sp. PtaB.Bin001]|nr:MAG: Antilisterial bacteriocin subtilosin biosynthesis protein AlbA [Syntrophus sp. PtaB.Bin001]